MAKSYRVNLNLNGLQLLNAAMQPAASAPSAISAGQIYYNTSGNLYFSTAAGTGNWVQLATGTSALASLNGLTVATTLQGTANQITVTTSSPNITISFPATGVTLPGKTTLSGSTTSTASLNIPAATAAPTTPVLGDVWATPSTGTNILYYNGATKTIAFTDSNITGSAGSVANALTIGTGLSGTSYNGSSAVTIANTGVLSVNGSTGAITNVALTTGTLAQFASTTSSQLASIISDKTGTGSLTFANTPTLVTPNIGVATATTINGLTLTSSASGFTIAGGTTSKTLTLSNTVTLAGTDGSTLNIGTGGTLGSAAFTASTAYLTSGVTSLPLVTSVNGTTIPATATLLTSTSTTSGLTSFGTSPTLVTPILGAATATSINGLTISSTTGTLTLANGSTFAISGANSVTITSTGATNVTLPTSGTLVNTSVTSLTSLGTISTALTGYVSAAAGVLSASSTIPGTSVSGNISGNAANVTGIVALANGGTNANLSPTAGGIVWSNSTQLQISSTGTTGYLLTSNGTSAPTWTQSTATNVNNAVVQRDGTGNISVSQVTVSADPSQALQVATKQYVDNLSSGINAHDAVVAATTTALTVTYSNGASGVGATLTNAGTQAAFSIDNVTPVVGDRVLIKNQAAALQNGIYTVTNVGSGSTNWVLTRATDYDNHIAGQVNAGDMTFVTAPAAEFSTTPTQQNTGWIMNAPGTITIGTSSIAWVQSSGSGVVTAGSGISVTGNSVSIALGATFDSTTGADTTGLSLSSNTLKVRLNSNGGLTSTTAGIAVNPGLGFSLSGNQLVNSSGTTTQTGSGVSGGAYSYATQKQVATITGNNTLTSFAVNHNFNSQDVTVQVYQTSVTPDTQYSEVEVDIVRTSTSVVTVSFAVAPATGVTYNVVIVG
jgi:hypothetical protein